MALARHFTPMISRPCTFKHYLYIATYFDRRCLSQHMRWMDSAHQQRTANIILTKLNAFRRFQNTCKIWRIILDMYNVSPDQHNYYTHNRVQQRSQKSCEGQRNTLTTKSILSGTHEECAQVILPGQLP